MMIRSLRGTPRKRGKQSRGLRGISTKVRWVCPTGTNPKKLSASQRRKQCRKVVLASAEKG